MKWYWIDLNLNYGQGCVVFACISYRFIDFFKEVRQTISCALFYISANLLRFILWNFKARVDMLHDSYVSA